MRLNKKTFNSVSLVIIAVLFISSLGYAKYREHFLPTANLKVGNVELKVEVADSVKSWQKGLSGRKSLPENKGMLFVFPQEDRQSFWMKDMEFPIDIIWINNGKIVDIAPNVQPSFIEPLPQYLPRLPSKFVLETVAGFSLKNKLKIGDSVEILTK
ncbi:MAG TPA: DUF192 domain-containing protein [Candidatus Magasanikbacteria bacterium]|nr:DUF192 domain-containing protein [Candidatus Magasanikbacteria bacterium]